MTNFRWCITVCILGLGWPLFLAAQGDKTSTRAYLTPEEATQADDDFQLQGEYVGPRYGVQVVAQGAGEFVVVTYRGGLPGAGWSGVERHETEEDAAGVRELIRHLELEKKERRSPTLGATPPRGAAVLFDGSRESVEKHWLPGARHSDRLLLEGCTSRDPFTDFVLHLEYRVPYTPLARGQARGNSGVYLQGRYELQILDSFGLEAKDNDGGGLYSQKGPDLNMNLPPLAWQTLDVEFSASRWNAAGEKTANARISVRHNGVVIHQEVDLPQPTTAAPLSEGPEPGPIYLQNHQNPVRFRNIWVLPRNAAHEALRPIVPGFERFHASSGTDLAAGGRLLLNELQCAACHAGHESSKEPQGPGRGPILDDVGQRIHPDYLIRYLSAPHEVKPGTKMPDLFRHWPEEKRKEGVLALANFLTTTGTMPLQSADPQALQRGARLYQEVGCIACHGARDTAPTRTSVPLGDLPAKYSIPSLASFLNEPHRVRPGGRMPALVYEPREAIDLATYLIGPVEYRPKNPNYQFAAYEGSWNELPRFEELQPYKTGEAAGLDVGVAGRANNYGVRFRGFLKIDRPGMYTFHLGSDDGSRLMIDREKVVDVDGIHPHETRTGKVSLTAGMHPVQVDYFQGGGEATLAVEYEGPGVPRQDFNRAVFLTEKGPPPAADEETSGGFRFDPALVDQGRRLFSSVGCANCHQLVLQGERVISSLAATPLAKLRPEQGCLAAEAALPAQGSAPNQGAETSRPQLPPNFDLNWNQREALAAALSVRSPSGANSPAELIAETMTAFNCYACHARGGVGGPERDRNSLFLTRIPEMGDEGRVPPPLDGVGDKLTSAWLRHVLQQGAKDRPYMLTRMPRFALSQVEALAGAFEAADRQADQPPPELSEAEHRVKATGRHLVGDQALGCVKCHTFGPHKTPGVQALDLQTMTRRIREDWFLRYMLDPQAYRPGTRMPTGFANGRSSVRDGYEGDPTRQLAAIWAFLKEGDKGGIPDGLVAHLIELKPDERPIIYRNFIEGLSPRGIAVGYPERAHLAWDANRMCLTLIWHGRFIDAAKHWEGRGPGFQGPLGDHVMRLEETAPIAILDRPETSWPNGPPRDRGYRFRGYQLDAQGRPRFEYSAPTYRVVDFPRPMTGGSDPYFERRLTVTAQGPLERVYFRAAVATKIESASDGTWVIDGQVRMRFPGTDPRVRESEGKRELLIPIVVREGRGEVVQEIRW
ncbi:MAG: family 16 glycoside hydrolase [Planctomycetales bacterium]